jgi:hypothetical protein
MDFRRAWASLASFFFSSAPSTPTSCVGSRFTRSAERRTGQTSGLRTSARTPTFLAHHCMCLAQHGLRSYGAPLFPINDEVLLSADLQRRCDAGIAPGSTIGEGQPFLLQGTPVSGGRCQGTPFLTPRLDKIVCSLPLTRYPWRKRRKTRGHPWPCHAKTWPVGPFRWLPNTLTFRLPHHLWPLPPHGCPGTLLACMAHRV